MTNNDLIEDALRIIGVIPEGQNANSADATLGLTVMNDMLAEWAENDIDVEYWPQDDLQDDSPLDASEVAAVKYMLAVTLAPYFGREAPGSVGALAGQYYTKVLRRSLNRSLEASDANMPASQGVSPAWDITKG